jgi:hypothetical protein
MVWAQYRKVYSTSLEVKVLDVAAETLLYCLWNSPLHRRRRAPRRRRDMLYDSREESSYIMFRRPSCKCDTAPFFRYSDELFCSNLWTRSKHIWIKKATGLGMTEFMLRYIAWLCLRNNNLQGTQMCIVTGPRIDLAITLIDRMKRLFIENGLLTFDSKETVIELNRVHIEAYPSHHLDAMRGLSDVSFVLLDEADFFPPGQQQDARDVSERYIAKSNPWIVTVSTPNAPDGLFERIEKEPEETCLYKRLFLDYTYGLDRIYTSKEIEKAKASPSFEREYNLKYLGLIGNVFHTKDIESAIEKGKKYNPYVINVYSRKSLGIDPGFGSSPFGLVVTEWVDNQIQIAYAEEFERPDFNQMMNITLSLASKYAITFDNSCRIFVDGANPSFIRSLKYQLGENVDYEQEIDYYKKSFHDIYNLDFLIRNMFVVPVHFAKEHKRMFTHAKKVLEYNAGSIAINPRFDKLITSLRTAVENGEGLLDKEATSYDDIFDAFRMSLLFYQ